MGVPVVVVAMAAIVGRPGHPVNSRRPARRYGPAALLC
jgi:hypothetical protein